MEYNEKKNCFYVSREEVERIERQAREVRAMAERLETLQRLCLWATPATGKRYQN